MGLLQKLLKGTGGNKKEFKAKFKQAQEEDKIMNMVEERKKSANQRELERYMQTQREDNIKEQLDRIHKKQNKDNWKSPNMVLKQESSILKNDRPILKEKNIFLDHKSKNVLTQKRMFFK